MDLKDFGALAAILVAVVGLPLSLGQLTRPARLRRNLKSDSEVLVSLHDGPSKQTMQRLVDEQVERLDRLVHPNWERRIVGWSAVLTITFVLTGTLGLVLDPRGSITLFRDAPVLLVIVLATIPMVYDSGRSLVRIARGQDEFGTKDKVGITDEVTADQTSGDEAESVGIGDDVTVEWPRGESDDVEERRPQ